VNEHPKTRLAPPFHPGVVLRGGLSPGDSRNGEYGQCGQDSRFFQLVHDVLNGCGRGAPAYLAGLIDYAKFGGSKQTSLAKLFSEEY